MDTTYMFKKLKRYERLILKPTTDTNNLKFSNTNT